MKKECKSAMEQIEKRYSKGNETKIGVSLYKKQPKIMVKEVDKLLFFGSCVI
jgi:hypothetical protein